MIGNCEPGVYCQGISVKLKNTQINLNFLFSKIILHMFIHTDSFFGIKSNIKRKIYNTYRDYDFSKFKAVLSQFRTPMKEHGAQTLCDNVFPKLKDKIVKEAIPTHKDVNSFDAYELKFYCKNKSVSKREINLTLLEETLGFVSELFKSSERYYSINSYKDCLDSLPKDTSSGFPRYMKKGLDVNVVEVFKEMEEFDSHLRVDKKDILLQSFPTTIFHRFTPKMKRVKESLNYNVNYKIRQIFGVTHFICGLEVKYLTYFVNNFKKKMRNITTIGLTRPEVSDLISQLRLNSIRSGRVVLCGDLKGCDKSVPAHFHRYFFDTLISLSPNEFVKNSINSIGNYITYTPVLRRNEVSYTNGSTVSGSWITTIFNTTVVYIGICYFYLVAYGRFPRQGEVLVQGDDFVLVIDEVDTNLIQELFFLFNLRIKLDNTLIARGYDDIEFLGFKWDYVNTPFQEDSWIYVRTVYPERSVAISGPDRVICRYLSLIFQCNNGFELFKRFLFYDESLKEKINFDPNPSFELIDNAGKVTINKVPIRWLIDIGWRAF
jgi:hypothetical protein